MNRSRSCFAYAMQEIKDTLDVDYEEVVVPVMPEVEMSQATFTIPQRGDKAKLLEVSVRNARQSKIDSLKHMEKADPAARTDRVLGTYQVRFPPHGTSTAYRVFRQLEHTGYKPGGFLCRVP